MTRDTFTFADLNEGFVVAIEIEAKAGEENAVEESLKNLIKPTMVEPGVKLFLPYRSATKPGSFFIFELYLNELAWADHQKTDHFKAFVAKTLPRIARRKRAPFMPFMTTA